MKNIQFCVDYLLVNIYLLLRSNYILSNLWIFECVLILWEYKYVCSGKYICISYGNKCEWIERMWSVKTNKQKICWSIILFIKSILRKKLSISCYIIYMYYITCTLNLYYNIALWLKYRYGYTYSHTHIYIYIYIYIVMHILIYIYIYIYICIYICI